ncbi:hypothetical protein ACFL31_04320, partial [Candidatus Margulisiibacteriota bacterium]
MRIQLLDPSRPRLLQAESRTDKARKALIAKAFADMAPILPASLSALVVLTGIHNSELTSLLTAINLEGKRKGEPPLLTQKQVGEINRAEQKAQDKRKIVGAFATPGATDGNPPSIKEAAAQTGLSANRVAGLL